MKGQVHIAFHYKETRIPILEKVVSLIKKWEDETDIIIHTNTENEVNIEGVSYIVWQKLEHPYLLTYAPMNYIADNFNKESYDFYVYVEDDIGISPESYAYWKRYKSPRLGFLRYSGEILYDLDKNPIVDDNNIIFDRLYKAFWINTREQMKDYLKDKNRLLYEIMNNIEWSRERCAYGNSYNFHIIPKHELNNALVEHIGMEETAIRTFTDYSVPFCKFTIKQLKHMIQNADPSK